MLAFVSLLLLVIGQIACSHENCDKIEGLKPFHRDQIYECTFNGFFADETDRNCRQYVVCARNTRSFTTLYLTCPKGTYFNPDIKDCTSNYDCPYEYETESTTDISTACNYTSHHDHFRCYDSGNFANDNDPTCRSYFYCLVILKPSLYVQIKYTCPENFYFNPYTKMCDDVYVCSCSSSTNRPISTTRRERTATSNTQTTDHDVTIPYNGCDYIDDPDYFTCTVHGRFRNNNDKDCKSYYLCSVLRSGRIIQTKYDCPGNSLFNPKKQLCDAKYKCPCYIPSTSTITTEASVDTTTTTAKTISEDTFSTQINTENNTNENQSSSTSPSTPTTTEHSDETKPNDKCVYDDNPNYFTCTVKGRFRNNNDRECKSYYLCSILSTGRIIQTKYDCPGNSLFNPKKQLCDVKYKCPCYNPSTSTINIPTISTETSVETTTTSANDDTHSTQISTENTTKEDQSSTTSPLTTTTENSGENKPNDKCIYDENPNYFTCTVQGRFRNNNDRECRSYYLCSVLRSGRIIQTKYDCPENSFFNPKKQLCDVKYKCPCTDEFSTTNRPTKTPRTAETSSDNSASSISSEEPEEASTSSEINTTNTTEDLSTANSPSPRMSTPNQECVYDENPNYFTCTVPGRFRNNNDLKCKSYYLCIVLRSGKIYQTKYDCPENSLFNPEVQLCDAKYKCPCYNPSTSTISSTTITTETSTETTATTVSDVTLSTQVSTEKTTNEDQSSSTLPSTTEISNGTNTDDSCIYDDNPNYFTCTVQGRFRNNNDRKCRSYYLCSVLRSGRIIQTKYDCPENSFFNPNKQLCDVNYKCPCPNAEFTTTTIGPTKTSRTAETSSDNSASSISSEEPEGASVSSEINTTNTTEDHSTANSPSPRMSTPNQECVYDENPNYFTCTVPGRFRNNNDLKCKSYYLCIVLRSGKIYQTKYDCPENSLFNPEVQLCDAKYKCPCYNPSTSTISTTTITTETSTETTATTVSDVTLSTQVSTKETTNEDQSSSTLPSTTEISNGTNTDDSCIYDDNPNYFTCTVQGRFRNNNDRKCRSYYLCTVLRSGRIIQTKYDCPENSFFNPNKQLCDVNYKCPCPNAEFTTTTIGPTKTSRTAETSSDNAPSSISSEEPEGASTSSEINTTNTTEDHSTANSPSPRMSTPNQECVYDENPNYFTCTVPGRFRNNNDLKCKSYYLCIVLRSGKIYQTKYDCPENSLFNPEVQLCDAKYKCPCTTFTTISTPNISTTETTPIETAQTTISTHLPDESSTITTITTILPSTTTIVPTTTVILPTTTTILPTTTEENCPFYDSDPNYFICNRKGRFRNNNDKNCETYFLCSELRSGLFLKTKYFCPSKSFFNPEKNLCDVDYKCEC